MSDLNYGWVCPKCGCPNAPTNKTCVACFSHEDPAPKVLMPIIKDTLPPTTCSTCGIKITSPMGYVCRHPDCPCGFGPKVCMTVPGITGFNPLNAKDNT